MMSGPPPKRAVESVRGEVGLGGDMKGSARHRIAIAILALVTVLAFLAAPVAANQTAVEDTPVATTVATSTPGDEVTDLPATGLGSVADDDKPFAFQQMLTTLLVLVAAATLALGGIALASRHDQR